jgi:hypothetical protein
MNEFLVGRVHHVQLITAWGPSQWKNCVKIVAAGDVVDCEISPPQLKRVAANPTPRCCKRSEWAHDACITGGGWHLLLANLCHWSCFQGPQL